MIQGNLIGTDSSGQSAIPNSFGGIGIVGGSSSNLVGGTSGAARNIISGNANQGIALANPNTSGNVIQGNHIGVNLAGTAALANSWAGVSLYAGPQFNRIGGDQYGAGNVISGNANQGVVIGGSGSEHNYIQGNLIGLNAAGNSAIPNAWPGIELYGGAANNVIGGGPGARNFVSGNGHYGVALSGTGTAQNRIQGNTVGLAANGGSTLPNTYAAIAIFGGASSNRIGGVESGAANLITGSLYDGVQVLDAASTNNSARGNSIFNNSGRAVLLHNNANRNQTAPALASATLGLDTVISGTLNSVPDTTFQLDFYSDIPPTGSAEGRTYLGSTEIVTTSAGTVGFATNLASRVPAGRVITASATDPFGNTSQLSPGISVATISSGNDGIPDVWRATFFGVVTPTNSQNCATCDPDQDGADNAREFFAGTNPTNAISILQLIALQPNSSNAVTRLSTVAGMTYRVESRETLGSGVWSLLADQIRATGTNLTVVDPAATVLPQRLYRAAVLQ